MRRAFLFGLALLLVCPSLEAQTKIRILSAEVTDIVKQKNGSRAYYLRGNVGLQHDEAIMTCDSAILIQPDNEFKAFKNVRIVQADTTIITGKTLEYDGDSRTFTMNQDVELSTPSSLLQTNQLFYDRNRSTAYYSSRSVLHRKNLELTSDYGIYNTEIDVVNLKGEVVAIDSAYSLYTDTLLYYPAEDLYRFVGPSTLLRDSTTIVCKQGEYNSEKAQLNLSKRATISSPGSFIRSDSLSYNLKGESGQLFGRALVADSAEGLVLESAFIDYVREPNFVDAFSPVYYRQRLDSDTLYASGDTLYLRTDTSGFRTVHLRDSTKFFSDNFQGRSTYFNYEERYDALTLFPKPLMWSKKSQFACDSAILTFEEDILDSLFLIGNTTIVSLTDDSIHFDQAAGKQLEGQFKNNELSSLKLTGNAQNITHSISDAGQIEGVNKTSCAFITITFIEGDVNKVNAHKGVEASYAPWSKATVEMKELPGCTPLFEKRTKSGETRLPSTL